VDNAPAPLPTEPVPATPGLVPAPAPSIAALQGRAPFGVPARITHDAEGELRFAIVPLPTYANPTNTLAQRKSAIGVSYSGRLSEGVDLYRSTILADGFFDGILRTMAEGVLQLPLAFSQGTEEMRSALLNADGTAGDFAAMHPLEECAQIVKDGLVGFPGLGQYLLMCWNCGWTDHDRVMADLEEGVGGSGVFEVCKRCHARRDERPMGQRELFRLEWRDCRWLDQNPVTFQWYYTGRNGRVPIIDGDGEWFMFFTTPRLESWRHGIWIWGSLYAIFARDAMYDAQNTSQVCAPTPVLRAVSPVNEKTRAAAEARIRSLGFDNRFVLNGEWIYEIVSAKAEYKDICTDIVNRCSDAFETGLTGNVMGRAARTAFTDAGIYRRTTAERRGAVADLWMRQVREKGLVHWGRDNYGTRQVPVGTLDVRSPEDKLAAAKSLSEIGAGVKALAEGLRAVAVRPTVAWVQEYMQQAGIRVEAVPGDANEAKLPLDPAGVMACVRGGPALASLGLPPFGDQRDDMTLAQLANLGKAGGSPAPATTAPTAPVPDAGAPPPSPAPPAARQREEDDEDADDEEDARRSALAAGLAGARACEHGRTHTCPRCGVQRVYGAPVVGADGQRAFPVEWRPTQRAPRRAPPVPVTAKAQRARALAGVGRAGPTYEGAKPLPPELAQHPGLTARPTETYPNPSETGGWRYVIDGGDAPEADPSWIAFVGVDGKALLWTSRDESGGVNGAPYAFRRDDLVS
jgi:hypothetical protein